MPVNNVWQYSQTGIFLTLLLNCSQVPWHILSQLYMIWKLAQVEDSPRGQVKLWDSGTVRQDRHEMPLSCLRSRESSWKHLSY